MEFVEYLLPVIMESFGTIFDFITLPITDFLTAYSSGFSDFLLGLITFAGLDTFLSSFTFGTLILGSGLLFFMVFIILYFFIP